MTASPWLLGADAAHVEATHAALGPHATRLFTLAQRCVWGITQADLVRVDVSSALATLQQEFPAHPMKRLLAAFLLHESSREHAARELAAAREQLGAGHPLSFMLPTQADWAGAVRPQTLTEVVAGRVWRVHGSVRQHGTRFSIESVGTIVRTDRGQLVFINPVALSREALAEVRALGPMLSVAVQGRAHSRFAADARAQFPEARLLLSEGHRAHPASAGIVCDGALGTESARLPDEFLQLPVRGTDQDEVVLYHHPTRLLVFQDLVSNNTAAHHARAFVGRLEYFAFGLVDRIGLLSYHPLLWHDLSALQRSLRAIGTLDAALITGAHWPLQPVGGAGRAGVDAALQFVLGLSKARHVSLIAKFFARQPAFLRDLVRYRLRAR